MWNGSVFEIRIRIHKVVENGSNFEPDPQSFWKVNTDPISNQIRIHNTDKSVMSGYLCGGGLLPELLDLLLLVLLLQVKVRGFNLCTRSLFLKRSAQSGNIYRSDVPVCCMISLILNIPKNCFTCAGDWNRLNTYGIHKQELISTPNCCFPFN